VTSNQWKKATTKWWYCYWIL